MTEAFVVGGVRTPVGREPGSPFTSALTPSRAAEYSPRLNSDAEL
jgi:hypothetical protein